MAATPHPSFTVDAAVGTSFGAASSNVALPGTPASDACVRIANTGPCHIAVKLGVDNTVTVTPSTGLVIPAGQVEFLTIGANTFIAGVAMGGNSVVNLATGT